MPEFELRPYQIESVRHMTENEVREYAHIYKDAEKIEHSLEIRKPLGSTSDWQRLPPKS
jgi:hypothetical protein